MKKLISLLVMLVLLVPAAWAQTVDIEQVEANGNVNTDENPGAITADDLATEFGQITPISNLMEAAANANNVASIDMRGNNNRAVIKQIGSNNIGAISIDGSNNRSITMNQNGSDLISLMKVEGSGNSVSMDQDGSNLGNLVQVLGSNMDIDLTQSNSGGFRYQQSGMEMPMEITTTRSHVPIIITNN